MISTKDISVITGIFNSILGPGSVAKVNEYSYHCPFCHHHKKKLQINLEKQYWHCWVCNAKGRTIHSLLSKLNVGDSYKDKIRSIYGTSYVSNQSEHNEPVSIKLPTEFSPLSLKPAYFNPTYNNAVSYLKSRGIGHYEILKYNIGYCESGLYKNRIIIPSYDGDGQLNYFVARTIYPDIPLKYKNPPVSKDVIIFENHINWSQPINLVEGVFDAIAIRRNAIPLLGKFIPKTLKSKIFEMGVTHINIILDPDAVSDSVKHSDFFMKNGITVKNIILTELDASDSGFETVNALIKESKLTDWGDLIHAKLSNL